MTRVPHIITNDGVTVVLDGRPFTVSSADSTYADLVRLLDRGAPEYEFHDLLTRVQRELKKTLAVAADMEYSGGVIKYKGEVLANYAADRLIQQIEGKRDWKPLANFLEKLQANPSKRAVDNLYQFLEKGNIPLTGDGDFLVYKAVRQNFKDIHSGKFDNYVGAVCEMPRNAVDEDPNRTCSSGLHVCSFGYLPSFSHADGHVMICKVNPAHVVAIPADYNNSKMRVSRYEVVGEVLGYYSEHVDVLGNAGEADGVMEPEFEVVLHDGWGSEDVGTFYTFEEAKRQAQRAYDESDDAENVVTVTDRDDFVVWTVDEDGARA
jgi:hypothetical protein